MPNALADAASLQGGRVDNLLVFFLAVCGVAVVVVHVAAVITWLRGGRRGWVYVAVVFAAAGLLLLFWTSEREWQRLKADRGEPAGEPQRVMVIGERFRWSVIYPGGDNEVGSYLQWPKPDDELWPNPLIVDMATAAEPPAFTFAGVAGPADLPEDRRESAIERYREIVNPFGKDFTDPRGWDDDYSAALGRDLNLEAGRPVEVRLGSKDVIHDFFVPAMRIKMDAVPGNVGIVRFTPVEPGTYTLLCAEFCGWGHTEMIGSVVVEDRP